VGRRVRLTIDRRREDAVVGAPREKNYNRMVVGFRLKGVPSSVDSEKWVADVPRGEADVLEATAVAIDAVLREGGEGSLGELKFTGGDSIYGRRVSKL